jgi:hypothetical protein
MAGFCSPFHFGKMLWPAELGLRRTVARIQYNERHREPKKRQKFQGLIDRFGAASSLIPGAVRRLFLCGKSDSDPILDPSPAPGNAVPPLRDGEKRNPCRKLCVT